MLTEIAIGDAYGASFEFAPKKFVKTHNTGNLYVKHHSRDIKPGCYTDDTQMSLAIVEMILDDIEFTPLNVADKFVEVFKRDPRQGYGGIYKLLNSKKVNSGIALLRRITPCTNKNGSMMRSVPLGIIHDPLKVVQAAAIQSSVTHCSPNAILASQYVALAAHWAIYNKEKMALPPTFYDHWATHDFCKDYMDVMPNDILKIFCLKNGDTTVPVDAIKTLRAVLLVLSFTSTSYKDILVQSCSLTGDTDSVAAVAMGIASLYDYHRNLPKQLINGLENEKYGLDYLIDVDKKINDFISKIKIDK